MTFEASTMIPPTEAQPLTSDAAGSPPLYIVGVGFDDFGSDEPPLDAGTPAEPEDDDFSRVAEPAFRLIEAQRLGSMDGSQIATEWEMLIDQNPVPALRLDSLRNAFINAKKKRSEMSKWGLYFKSKLSDPSMSYILDTLVAHRLVDDDLRRRPDSNNPNTELHNLMNEARRAFPRQGIFLEKVHPQMLVEKVLRGEIFIP